jgi:hypothetical protein
MSRRTTALAPTNEKAKDKVPKMGGLPVVAFKAFAIVMSQNESAKYGKAIRNFLAAS